MASAVAQRIIRLGGKNAGGVAKTLAVAYEAGELTEGLIDLFENAKDSTVARVLNGTQETMNLKNPSGKRMAGSMASFIPATRAHAQAWLDDLAAAA